MYGICTIPGPELLAESSQRNLNLIAIVFEECFGEFWGRWLWTRIS